MGNRWIRRIWVSSVRYKKVGTRQAGEDPMVRAEKTVALTFQTPAQTKMGFPL